MKVKLLTVHDLFRIQVRMKAKCCLHSMTCDRLDGEGNVGDYGGMTG